MVVVKYAGEIVDAVWADGRMPDRPRLEALYRSAFSDESRDVLDVRFGGQRDHQHLFDDLLVRTYQRAPQPKPKLLDAFHLTYPGELSEIPLRSPLHRELSGSPESKPEHYTQLIVVAQASESPEPARFVKDLLDQSGFELRSENTCRDFASFAQSVEEMLDKVAAYYSSPSHGVRQRLGIWGFGCDDFSF